jgi:hypothetical protein
MIEALAIALTVFSLATGVGVLGQAARGTFREIRLGPALVLLQFGLVTQAILDGFGLARGHAPRELSTHLAYLAVSLVVVPIVAAQTRGDDGRWSAALVGLALLVVAVLVIRLQTTWRGGHG